MKHLNSTMDYSHNIFSIDKVLEQRDMLEAFDPCSAFPFIIGENQTPELVLAENLLVVEWSSTSS